MARGQVCLTMKERQDSKDVRGLRWGNLVYLHALRDYVLMGNHHCLWQASRAAAEAEITAKIFVLLSWAQLKRRHLLRRAVRFPNGNQV